MRGGLRVELTVYECCGGMVFGELSQFRGEGSVVPEILA